MYRAHLQTVCSMSVNYNDNNDDDDDDDDAYTSLLRPFNPLDFGSHP